MVVLLQLTVLIILNVFHVFNVQNDDGFQLIFLNDGETEMVFVVSDGEINGDESLMLISNVHLNDESQLVFYYELINALLLNGDVRVFIHFFIQHYALYSIDFLFH